MITGHEAIERAREDESVSLHKYSDPTEGQRFYLMLDEAEEIAEEDPGLIYAEVGP